MTPTTERVQSGRRGAAIVAVGLVAVLGVLIARPWDSRPSPSPVAVVASLTVSTPGPTDSATVPLDTSEPAATPGFVLPTPDIAPPGAAGEAAIVAPLDVAVVQCRYGPSRDNARRLAAIEVQPPLVLLDPDASAEHIRRIGWHFEVETNELQSIFERAWQRVDRSAWQVAPANTTRPAAFNALRSQFSVGPVEDTAAVRVRIVVEWYTRNDEVAGRAELVPNTYREGNAEFTGEWPPYCRVVL